MPRVDRASSPVPLAVLARRVMRRQLERGDPAFTSGSPMERGRPRPHCLIGKDSVATTTMPTCNHLIALRLGGRGRPRSKARRRGLYKATRNATGSELTPSALPLHYCRPISSRPASILNGRIK
jgi:hypothetical protein